MSAMGAVRTWALVTVAVTSSAVIGLAIWLTWVLAYEDWCAKAVGATAYAEGRPEFAIGGCFQLLRLQVEALAWNSHMVIGVLAMCLLTLIVIVIAGGRLTFKGSKDGVEANIGAARQVADAADDEATKIEGG